MKENNMLEIVELIDKVIMNIKDEKVITDVRVKVNGMMKDFPLSTH
jgi:glycine hydroxymethyltransferase